MAGSANPTDEWANEQITYNLQSSSSDEDCSESNFNKTLSSMTIESSLLSSSLMASQFRSGADDDSIDDIIVPVNPISAHSDSGVSASSHTHTSSDVSANASEVSAHSSAQSQPDDEDILVFKDVPNQKLFCQLCQQIFRDPFIASCGHTFCRKCILLHPEEVCPVDGIKLSLVVSNIAVQDQIKDLIIQCKHGCKLNDTSTQNVIDHDRCPKLLRLGDRRIHEDVCEFAWLACPNDNTCSNLMRKDLHDHLKICKFAKCEHHKYGCQFRGPSASLKLHQQSCRFEEMKDYLRGTEIKITQLQSKLHAKDEEISFLRNCIKNLTKKLDALEKRVDVDFNCFESDRRKLQEDVMSLKTNFVQTCSPSSRMTSDIQTGQFEILPTFKCKGTFVGHSGPVWCLCVHNDLLFSGSSDKTVKVWDLAHDYKCIRTLDGHTGLVLSLCVLDDKLYSGSQDRAIIVWSLDDFCLLFTVEVAHENPVCTLAATNIGSQAVVFSGSLKVIKVWDCNFTELTVRSEMTGLNHWVRALVSSKSYLYSGSYQTVKIWNLENLSCLHELHTTGGSVYSIALTDEYILCGTYENCIHVWRVDDHSSVTKLSGHTGTVYALAVIELPQSQRLFSGSYDKSLKVWDLGSLQECQTLLRHESSVACLAVSRNRIFSGAVDSTVKLWQ